jgi:ABC-type nitrate/sulfonate/bicarbonate transport system ATPase subunit
MDCCNPLSVQRIVGAVEPPRAFANAAPASQAASAAPDGAADEPVVEVRIERKAFRDPGTGTERLILDGLELRLRPGELVAVVGPSGCGKTTLLQLVAGLDSQFTGSIRWPGSRNNERPSLGYVFQNPRLLPWLSLRANVALAVPDARAAAARIDGLLETMGLTDAAHLTANRLSVGMQRRAALARAFAVQPRLLLMDEPFVSLDAPTAASLRRLLLDLCESERPTVVFVTHDLREATQLADRVVFLCAPPARAIGEAQVGLDRDARRSLSAVDARHRELGALFRRLYGEWGADA